VLAVAMYLASIAACVVGTFRRTNPRAATHRAANRQ
jgi:hypothetical protein